MGHPHWPMNCAIELIPRAKLPELQTPKEMEELRRYIDKNLAKDLFN